jgi:hypothetical protein
MRKILSSVAAFALGTALLLAPALAQQFGSGSYNLYQVPFTPTATAAAIATVQQTVTVVGLTTTMDVWVEGPVPTSLCPMTNARISAANTLQVDFTVLTAAACTPASGTYNVLARQR